ncbi:11695_t:CDS:2 [Dentiscutata erythropus]|uniref:11695_t:CDS:1 n=1 Tax=Dentiscutata erythropus TaxID=1348616 RepID=A0A9N8Z852_9GLOM|nr:11695_t:CDS:2 [Dentiscutata erythropus]
MSSNEQQKRGSESNKNTSVVENSPAMNSINGETNKTKQIIWGFQDPNTPRVNCGAVLTNMPSKPKLGIWTPNPEKKE